MLCKFGSDYLLFVFHRKGNFDGFRENLLQTNAALITLLNLPISH